MSRPHEDRERHTLVDHRPGGDPMTFAAGSWLAVGVARVKAERNDACVAAYETLIEHARTSNVHAGPAVVFASDDERRVMLMVGVNGHDGFHRLAAAWDDHHRNAQHRVIAESVSFTLYEVAAAIGTADIDPATHDAFTFEHVVRPMPRSSEFFAQLAAAPEFVGATVLHDDSDTAIVILARFAHLTAYTAFRTSPDAVRALGSPGESGESSFAVHPRKTLALV